MKQPKKLTLRQKKLLRANKLIPENWMLVKETADSLQIINKSSRKIREIKIQAPTLQKE